ncbi:hypothetical protein P4H66_23170 [Paenibacillus dokdonensis]|uniref:Twin-arginine translocation signal domain-containing protein n=1 Tax=Paenibacillus dokdonensis TaxID=2567944 RepID=A0ABU6GSI6_9BACL|nr:hypothetical protein [Paenibacillus dokdonensis]MEC0242715.1 hypothetical protein [Paenibacillus dokdonensis]
MNAGRDRREFLSKFAPKRTCLIRLSGSAIFMSRFIGRKRFLL